MSLRRVSGGEDDDDEDKESFLEKTGSKMQTNHNTKKLYNSRHFHFLVVVAVVLGILVVALSIAVGLTVGFYNRIKSNDDLPSDPRRRAEALLEKYPVIDG